MTAVLLPVPKARFFTNAGLPLNGGKVYTYQSGTTTPLATYTDAGAGTANANPVVLDPYGYANIWLIGTYTIVLKDALGNLIWTEDNIAGLSGVGSYLVDTGGANAYIVSPSPASTGYVAGQVYDVKISAANSGASTINVSGLGAKNITYSDGTTLASGALPTASVVRLIYDGSQFQLQNIIKAATTGSFTTLTVSGATTLTGLVTLGNSINEKQGADIASATSTSIGTATGNYVKVTGTTTITSFDTIQAGTRRIVEFTGILTLTHNASSLILPGGANITTAAGDCATFVSEGSGNWRCTSYNKASGVAVVVNSGKLVNRVKTEYSTASSGSVAIPLDSTIPQIAEGAAVFSAAAYTPASASNIINVRCFVWTDNATQAYVLGAIFKDSGSNAVAAGGMNSTGTAIGFLELNYNFTAGSTTAFTMSLRVGAADGSATYWNRDSAGNTLGGMTSFFEITEYTP